MNNKEEKLTIRSLLNTVFAKKTKGEDSQSLLPKFTTNFNGNSSVLNGMVCYNEYGGYFTPISSKQRPAVRKILNGKVHEPDTISFIRANCKEGDVIHAGTFFGDFLPGISSALTEGAKLWAFEPNPENYTCAEITCLINQLTNVTLFNAGLGDRNTQLQMTIKSAEGESLGGASFITGKPIQGEKIDIDIVKIDDLVPAERQISILQLDVEGYEKQALMGAMDTIRRNRPILILEDHIQKIDSTWFNQNIGSLGYEKVLTLHGNTVYKA